MKDTTNYIWWSRGIFTTTYGGISRFLTRWIGSARRRPRTTRLYADRAQTAHSPATAFTEFSTALFSISNYRQVPSCSQTGSPRCAHPSSRSPHREAIKHRPDGFPLIGPEKRRKKAIRTKNCLSNSEFFSFRFFLSIAGIEPAPAKAGDNRRGRLLLVTNLYEARKVTAPRHERDRREAQSSFHQTLRCAQGEGVFLRFV